MPNQLHLEKLHEGTAEWNKWREENPGIRPDLSGINLKTDGTLRDALLEEWNDGRAIKDINLRDTDLREAVLEDVTFFQGDFRGSNLSYASISHCTFTRGGFAASVPEVEKRRLESGEIPESAAEDLRKMACKLENTSAFGTVFKIFSLSFADLTTMKVDEATRFERVGVIGTKITQVKLQMLDGYGGLSAGRRAQMQIVDDVATLRESFSGIWNAIHVVALLVFLAPYLWFLGEQWMLARVGESPPVNTETSMLIVNLCRFIWSGGDTWRDWDLNLLGFSLFVLAITFNSARAALFVKTKQLEHNQAVSGVYNEFRLRGFWKWLLNSYNYMGLAGIAVVVVHTLLFLTKPVPL